MQFTFNILIFGGQKPIMKCVGTVTLYNSRAAIAGQFLVSSLSRDEKGFGLYFESVLLHFFFCFFSSHLLVFSHLRVQ